MKVAFDENVPSAMVKVFITFAKERQLRYLVRDLRFYRAKDYTPSPHDHDYEKGNDVPWIRRFARAGGKVIISGNTKMMSRPHERLALINEGLIVVFFENAWNEFKFCTKCALLLHWWPVVAETVTSAQSPSFWRIPSNWAIGGQLRQLSIEDQKLLKLERQKAARPEKAAERRRRKATVETDPDQATMELGSRAPEKGNRAIAFGRSGSERRRLTIRRVFASG